MADLAFRITEPGKPVREIPIEVGVSIGRRPENTCHIDDPKVSGRHAHVVMKDGKLVVEDLGSSNHTHILGGASLEGGQSHALTLGTALQIGEAKFVVVAKGGADAGDDRTIAAQIITAKGADGGGLGSSLAMLAAFKAARPRLVIANEAIREIFDIEKVQVVVGRQGETTNLAIEHKAVSTCHATITYEDKRFFIEDMGSSNGTFVGADRLPVNQKVELKPETHLRFGSVDALFVVDMSAEGQSGDGRRYKNALEVLVAEGDIPASQRDEAVREATDTNRHPGEVLLLKGLVSVDVWIKAWRKAEFHVASGGSAKSIGSGGGGGQSKLLIIIIIVLLFVVGVLVAWQLGYLRS